MIDGSIPGFGETDLIKVTFNFLISILKYSWYNLILKLIKIFIKICIWRIYEYTLDIL